MCGVNGVNQMAEVVSTFLVLILSMLSGQGDVGQVMAGASVLPKEARSSIGEVVELKNEACTETFGIHYGKIFCAEFLVPVDFSEEDILGHAKAYAKLMISQHEDLFGLSLMYYDDDLYREYNMSLVAAVQWAPNAVWDYDGSFILGDYSTHKFSINYASYSSANELNEKEKGLYKALQDFSLSQRGEPIGMIFDTDYPNHNGTREIFELVSQEHGISVEELIKIAMKVTYRRYMPEG